MVDEWDVKARKTGTSSLTRRMGRKRVSRTMLSAMRVDSVRRRSLGRMKTKERPKGGPECERTRRRHG